MYAYLFVLNFFELNISGCNVMLIIVAFYLIDLIGGSSIFLFLRS